MNITDRRKYVIVEFPEEEEDGNIPMAIISGKWLIESQDEKTYCLWPGYFKNEGQRSKAVQNHCDLDAEICAKTYVRIIYSTYYYSRAVQKLKFLEDRAEVTQSEEDEPSQNNKRKRPKKADDVYVSEFESDYEHIPVIPKLNVYKKNPTNEMLPATNKILPEVNENKVLTTIVSTPSSSSANSLSSITAPPYECSRCVGNEGLMTTLLTLVKQIQGNVQYLISLQQANAIPENVLMRVSNISPANTKEELQELDDKMRNPEELATLCATLQVVGGKDIQDSTRRILGKIVTNNVALLTNWSGKNDKIAFTNFLNIINLITVTVRRNPLCRNATKAEIENVIKVWLRNAPDREGGRSKRKNEKILR